MADQDRDRIADLLQTFSVARGDFVRSANSQWDRRKASARTLLTAQARLLQAIDKITCERDEAFALLRQILNTGRVSPTKVRPRAERLLESKGDSSEGSRTT